MPFNTHLIFVNTDNLKVMKQEYDGNCPFHNFLHADIQYKQVVLFTR